MHAMPRVTARQKLAGIPRDGRCARSPESGVELALRATLHSDHRKVFPDAFGLVAQHVQLGDGRNGASKHWSRDLEVQKAPQERQSLADGSATRLSYLRR